MKRQVGRRQEAREQLEGNSASEGEGGERRVRHFFPQFLSRKYSDVKFIENEVWGSGVAAASGLG